MKIGHQAAVPAPTKASEGDTTTAEAGHLGRAYRGTLTSSAPPQQEGTDEWTLPCEATICLESATTGWLVIHVCVEL